MSAAGRPWRGVVWLARVGALAVVAGALLGLLSVRADGVWLLGVVLVFAGAGVPLFALAVLFTWLVLSRVSAAVGPPEGEEAAGASEKSASSDERHADN